MQARLGRRMAEEKKAPCEEVVPEGNQPRKHRTFILADGVFEVEPRYEIREIVGHGAYGRVCSAKDLQTRALVAVKKIDDIFHHRSLAKRTLRELKLLRYFKHENIMALERVMLPRSDRFTNCYLVSELMETDLACVIRSPQELTDEHCQFFIYQVLRGLKYIHSANVIHRDLKPRNLLVNSNCDLKICDFGLARVDDPRMRRFHMSDYIMTRWYRAPEVILCTGRYSRAVDIWSVGTILAELLGRKPLFPGQDSLHQITLIMSVLGHQVARELALRHKRRRNLSFLFSMAHKDPIPLCKLFPRANPLAIDLLEQMLVFDPDKRVTVEDALQHQYLEELHCEEDEPICSNFDYEDFAFEYKQDLSREDLRVEISSEIFDHYPPSTFQLPNEQMRAAILPSARKQPQHGKQQRRRGSF